jgi:hypothetical protein
LNQHFIMSTLKEKVDRRDSSVHETNSPKQIVGFIWEKSSRFCFGESILFLRLIWLSLESINLRPFLHSQVYLMFFSVWTNRKKGNFLYCWLVPVLSVPWRAYPTQNKLALLPYEKNLAHIRPKTARIESKFGPS